MNPENQFEKTAWRLLDGELTQEEFSELETTLLQSEEERARFLEIADFHGLLYQKLGYNTSEPSIVSMDEVIQRQQRRILKRSAFAAAALLLLTGLVMSVIWMKQAAPLLTFRHTDDAIFHITHANQEVSARGAKELAIGSRLYLNQGTIELTLSNGVQAIVRAPANVSLVEKNRIAQNEGIARYVVPKSAVGFQVLTPDLLVTDLGTEFGVVSSPQKLDQVHLFKGKVRIESRKGFKTRELVTGVQSRLVDSTGSLNAIDSSPELFKTSLEGKPPYLHLSFDELKDNKFEMSGNYPRLERNSAELVTGKKTPVLAPGKIGNMLELNGEGGFVQTNWRGISGSDPRSVVFWCKLPKPTKSTKSAGLVAWGNLRSHGRKFVVVTNTDPGAGQKGAIRYDSGKGYAIGASDLRDGEWHHVAVVMGGETDRSSGVDIQIYVDGEKENLTGFLPSNPDTAPGTDKESWLSVGRYRLSGMANHNFLNGSIDELYVISGILTQSEVQQMMRGEW